MESSFQFSPLYYILYDMLLFTSIAALIVLVIGLLKNIRWLAWIGVAFILIGICLIWLVGPVKVSVTALVDTPESIQAKIDLANDWLLNKKPVITYPVDGATVNGVTIKGTAKPNADVWAYINYPKDELACISMNSYASGGASIVDSKGNFEFALAEPCSKELSIVVSTEEPAADKTGACRSSGNVSLPITFTNSGVLPAFCSQ